MAGAEFVVIQFERDEHLIPVGVLLLEPTTDRLRLRYRQDWASIADPEDAEVLRDQFAQLDADILERSGRKILTLLEDVLSNALRISELHTISIEGSVDDTLRRLYAKYVLDDL